MKQQKSEGIKLTSVLFNAIILGSLIVGLTSGWKLIGG
jgi:hypothetical protein